ncbi:MAG: NAD(+) diphosphatase [Gammaproteobacteria bacterium]|nr:NAD(+) diphosphatase [Gammaproteobacteria bacterium]
METCFSGGYIDRATQLRRDAAGLAAAWHSPAMRLLPVWEAQCLIRDGAAGRLTAAELGARLPALEQAVFLGLEAGAPRFAVQVESREAPADLGHFGGLRDLISLVSGCDAALLAYARAMVNWHRQHRHCGACGAPNRPADGGFVLACSSASCARRAFPRLDPAIIVLVHHDRHCLLGRQASWPAQRFSTIAGFVEPGEALEDAVRREVAEETGIGLAHCHYMGSQPWPFPASLMIGFHAAAATADITLNDGELAEARWFSRADLAAGEVVLPPRASIAWRLVEAWYDAVPGPGLATLHREGAFLRPAGATPEQR